MLDNETKRRIDTARDILVGKVPDPKSQVEQITIALIYKFMDDMDAEAEELGAERTFFAKHLVNNVPKDFAQYSWGKLMAPSLGGFEMLNLYGEAITQMPTNPGIPLLFRDIFKNAYLPYRDPETLKSFLKIINDFTYDHSERLGDAFEYLLSVLGSQGDAGQFRTPRHIIDFMVDLIDPQKHETILDPACGTAGFLISAWKHILKQNSRTQPGDLLTPDERTRLAANIHGYDISPDMVRLSLVNLYLHGFTNPRIEEYDTLTSEDHWNEYADVILANPPFMSPKGGIKPHKRFTIQANRSEVLFVDYIAEHLTPNGRAAVIVPEGIIFQSGTAYKSLRETLVNDYLIAVISLPAGIFNPYSGVKTSILVMDRTLARRTSALLFAKIDNDGFNLGAQRRAVTGSDLPHAAQQIKAWLASVRDGSEFDATHSPNLHLVEKARIGENSEWNLSGGRYKDSDKKGNEKWPIMELGEICEIKSGGTPSRDKEEYWNGNIPWVGSTVCKNCKVYEAEEFITQAGLDNSAAKVFKQKTTLIALVGATIGKTALLEFECTTNQNVAGIYPLNDKELLPDYLFHVSQALYPEFLKLSEGKFRMANLSFVRSLKIPLPPLAVQQEIVAEIESYQKIIDGARRVVENYQPRISIHHDWPIVALGEVCERVQYGLSEKLNTEGHGYKTFRMNELVNGYTQDNGAMKYSDISASEFAKYKLNPGDILFNRTNSIEHVGRTGIFNLEGDYCFASYLIRLTLNKKANPFYVNQFMNTKAFQIGIKQFASRAIGQANINATSLQSYNIPLPDLDTQRAIVTQIEEEQQLVNANKQLIRLFEAKIKTTINRVWGEEA